MKPRPIAFSRRLYKWLLTAYPQSHREKYGAAMLQLFRDQCQDAWRENRKWGLALLWLRIMPDLLKTSVLEHLENLKGKKFMPQKMFAGVRSSSAAKAAFISVFIAVFLLVLFTATIVTFIVPEQYRSTARIKVDRGMATIPGQSSPQVASANAPYDPYMIQTEFEVIQSEVILDRVIDTLNLNEMWQKKYNYDGKFKTTDSRAALRRMIELRPVRNTSLINITVYSDDKIEAAKIANTIAETYQSYCREKAISQTKQAIHDVAQERVAQDHSLDVNAEETKIGDTLAAVAKHNGQPPVGWNVEIIEHAEVSQRPYRPNKPFNIFLGAFLGILIGLGAGGIVAFFVSRANHPPALPAIPAHAP